MSSQVIDGWKPIRGVPGKTIVWQNIDGSYTVTIDPLAIGDGSGDMLKSVYDADGDNIVDLAESVPWSGVADRPTEFNPSAHTHDGDDITSQVGSAAIADSVPWSGVTDKPTTFPPSSHDHDDRYYTESETDSLLAGYVLKSTFDVNTILIANDDNTPMALSVPASTIVGRGASGNIAALDASAARTVLGLATTDTPQFAGVTTGIIAPATDATSAVRITNAAQSSTVLSVDTGNGYVGVGTTAPESVLHAAWKNGTYDSSLRCLGGGFFVQNAGDHASDPASVVIFRRGRGSLASPTSILTNDLLGSMGFGAYDGTTWRSGHNGGAQIQVVSTQNWSSTARGARIVFRTTAVDAISSSDRAGITESGMSIGVSTPTISDGVGIDVSGKILRLRTSKTPASATATGNVGEFCWDANYFYICTATNTWRRVAHSSW